MRRLKILIPLVFSLLSGCGGGGGGGGETPFELIPVHFRAQVLVSNASFPVSIQQAPDGRLFYSELTTGAVRVIENGQLVTAPFATLPVVGSGNEGLLGLALDPDFESNHFVYTYSTAPNPARNRVVRFRDRGNIGMEPTVILDDLPFGGHDGGRITFGEDGNLFVSVGDAGNPSLSQDPQSLAGKILRIGRNGSIPASNPIPGSAVFALGVRNAFGLAVDPRDGTLYASDNGPSCDDELNIVNAGANLGWRPDQPCGDSSAGFTKPIVTFNPSIAPTGITFYRGDTFPGLKGQLLLADFLTGTVRRIALREGSGTVLAEGTLLAGDFGSLIDVYSGSDGNLYLASTDAVIRLAPEP